MIQYTWEIGHNYVKQWDLTVDQIESFKKQNYILKALVINGIIYNYPVYRITSQGFEIWQVGAFTLIVSRNNTLYSVPISTHGYQQQQSSPQAIPQIPSIFPKGTITLKAGEAIMPGDIVDEGAINCRRIMLQPIQNHDIKYKEGSVANVEGKYYRLPKAYTFLELVEMKIMSDPYKR